MSDGHAYQLVLTSPAVRAVQRGLPESVATAVLKSSTGSLIDAPTRVGKPLRADLTGIYSARRGAYRVLYRIDESRREVIVLRIDHRRDVYRT